MVGSQHDRLTGGRNLDRARHDDLGERHRRRCESLSAEPATAPIGVGGDDKCGVKKCLVAGCRKGVELRTAENADRWRGRSVGRASGRPGGELGGHGSWHGDDVVPVGWGLAQRRFDGNLVAGPQGSSLVSTVAGAEIGPPAPEQQRDINPACHGQRRPTAVQSEGATDERCPVWHPDRMPGWHGGRSAVGGDDDRADRRAGHRHPSSRRKDEPGPEEGDLERGSGGRIADEEVGDAVRERVDCATGADATGARAVAAKILNGGEHPRGRDLDRRHRIRSPARRAPVSGTKRTRSPARSSAGGSRRGSNIARGVRPMTCQPPGLLRG